MGQARVIEMVRRVTVEWKRCVQCGTRFEGLKKALFCSKPCANKADYSRHAAARRKARLEKYHAAKSAAR